jgi:hypothetical protein
VLSVVFRRLAWLGIALILVAGCALPGSSTAHPAPGTPIASAQAGDFLVGANVDVSNATGSQDEVSAAIDPADPNTLLAGSNSLQADPSVRVYGSSDAGLHWTSDLLPLPTTAKSRGAVDQWAVIGPEHRQAMAYIAFGKPPSPLGDGLNGLTLYVATRSGPTASWLAPASPVGGLPPQQSYDDKPALAADNGPASPYGGRLYVAWTRWIGQDGWLLVSSSAQQSMDRALDRRRRPFLSARRVRRLSCADERMYQRCQDRAPVGRRCAGESGCSRAFGRWRSIGAGACHLRHRRWRTHPHCAGALR